MTFVGKILVIVIMVFALFFLALSTVVFTTEVNWSARVTELNTQIGKLNDEKARLTADVSTQKTNLQEAKNALETASKKFQAELKDLSVQNAQRQDEITKTRTSVETALQQVDAFQKEAQARIDEAMVLRKNLETVQKQRDDFKLLKTDLDQTILQLKRDLEVAQTNNKDLREKASIYSSRLRELGQSDNVEEIKGRGTVSPTYPVEGEVVRVSPDNRTIEISLGSNDGLAVGNVLDLYSVTPTAEYLGKIQITSVDVQQSVGRVVGGKTIHGRKIKEGDHVTSQIKRRG